MKSRLSRRDFLKSSGAATLGAVSLLALAGCSSDDSDSSSSTSTTTSTSSSTSTTTETESTGESVAESSEVINIADGSSSEVITSNYIRPSLVVGGTDPGSIPVYLTDVEGRIVLTEMYENLFEQASFGSTMTPVLCDRSKGEFNGYDHESGSCTYTFYMYDYIKDSKGNEITANDAVFNFENFIAQGNTISHWVGATAVDDYTIELEFTQELDEVMSLDAIMSYVFIYSQKAYEESGDEFTMTAVGTGRYELVDYTAGSSITLTRRDDYWQTDESLIAQNQQANVQELRIDFISETAQKVIALETGVVDMVESLESDYIDEFKDDDRYTVFSYKDNQTRYVLFNCSSDSICHDVNMRLAIASAIDLDGLLIALGNNYGARAYSIGNDNFIDYNPEWETWDNYNTRSGAADADEVQALLDAAGYNGEEVVFLGGSGSTIEKIMTVIQAQLLNYGITVKITQLDSSALSAERNDSSAWDIHLGQLASKGYLATAWNGSAFNVSSSTTGHTTGFIEDDVLEELTEVIVKIEGNTTENMDACWQHMVDNVYVMALFSTYSNAILPADMTTLVRNGKKWIIHTACVYADPDA